MWIFWYNSMEQFILNALIGAAGSLVKMIIEDGGIQLPTFKGGKIYLGGVGGMIIGMAAGMIADHDYVTTFLGGFAGTSVINYLVASQGKTTNQQASSVEDIIKQICAQNTVDPALALRVAKCESGLNPKAINMNTDKSMDRGLFQINNKYHPEVTDEQAFDPSFATQFFCTAFKGGNVGWWNASRTCWDTPNA
jgi:hypothetical protein